MASFEHIKEFPDHQVEEIALINKAKMDIGEFKFLYDRYFEQLFLFVLKRVKSQEIASDITSQVFLKAMENLKKYKHQGFPFSSWLYRIARNEIFDLHKKNKIQMVLSIETFGLDQMIIEMEDGRSNEKIKEWHDWMYQGLKKLEQDELELIEMRFFEERPFKEISEILELGESSAKMRTYRILEKLKKHLSHEQ